MTLYKKNLGKQGEDIAVKYLTDNKYVVIERNFRSKFGEIDIVAQKGNKICFIEVKTRANLKKGKPHEAITPRKIHQLKKAATYFLLQHDYKKFKHTISVISILFEGQNYKIQFFESID